MELKIIRLARRRMLRTAKREPKLRLTKTDPKEGPPRLRISHRR